MLECTTDSSVKVKVDLSIIQLDTLLKALEDLRDIKETVCQYALVSGDDRLYNLANEQKKITNEIHDILDKRKVEYWGEHL